MIIFEDFLPPTTFAKNFGLLPGVVSKIFTIENALQSKNQFLRNPFGKSYFLRHLTITIAHKNLILEIRYTVRIMQIQCFCQEGSTFYIFFPKVNIFKTYCANFFRAS